MMRDNIIRELVRGRNVLDVGSMADGSRPPVLYRNLKAWARSVVGIDLLPSKEQTIIHGNMETCDLGRKFDVVVVGDVIEHVDNPGIMLDNISRHLHDDGR